MTESIANGAASAAEAERAPLPVIETVQGFRDAVAAIRLGHGPVAVDAERASGFRYSQRAYLIQVFRRGAGTFLFDPPAIGDLSELGDAIRDEEWVLHAASQDLACLREVGLDPTRVFDTELAARLLGLPRVGLGTVVEELLGIHLAKEHSAADWSTRPLPQAWLVYAALDVELLPDLRDAVQGLLERDDKVGIAQQEFAALVAREEKPPRAEPWRRLSGLHTVRGARGLAVARELWQARDAYAREVDTSPGRLVPDAALVAAARSMPASKRDLGALKEFNGRASRSQLDRWWEAIERGRATQDLPVLRQQSDALPPPRAWAERNPEADRRLKLARAELVAVAEQRALPIENLLTPELLRRLAWNPPAPVTEHAVDAALADAGARDWQREAVVPAIVQSFLQAEQPGVVEDPQKPATASDA
ncbi:ribonuclease D [Arenivirga flava]|uniref:3'-5' exonuclease n=1 Tax=Arenivirga flava TaxID=1930060 RepID=A0AA37UEP3_9MICO|nr:3'-5' exonuclease [Arenivirga flava]